MMIIPAVRLSFFFVLITVVVLLPSMVYAEKSGSSEASVSASGATIVTRYDVLSVCNPKAMQALANNVSARITVGEVPNMATGVPLADGVHYSVAAGALPAFCQVTGSFVTNPLTGKTANFLATFPENWNGKFLQYGCFSHCGFFALNDASSPLVTIIAQGMPGDSLRKGYASFGTDQGHLGREPAKWAENGPGKVNQDAIDDLLYRSNKVLARAAKEYTQSVYSELSGAKKVIERAYFSGCSGGGRDALVAASHFPEEFDGFIAGSPYAQMIGTSFQAGIIGYGAQVLAGASLSDDQVLRINQLVEKQCDATDGVKDGLIQNPAACNFIPERDLPSCGLGEYNANCFTKSQIDWISLRLSAITDEEGDIVQPAYAVSNLQMSDLKAHGVETLRVLAFGNKPGFLQKSIIQLEQREADGINAFRGVVARADFERAKKAVYMGIGAIPENLDQMIKQDRKLMIWQNLSDQSLTPYVTINYYKRLARRHSGYENLQKNVRLFALPGTVHCSGGPFGVGPNSFDALTAMENWVEEGREPNELIATFYPGTSLGGKDFSAQPGRAMPLCKFPEMARYSGEGDVALAANWYCPQRDERMAAVGESGRRAGVIDD